jgi:formamidopyrimidine-DNA glycosylase
MPELPEVETARRNLEKAFRGKKIKECECDVQAPQVVARALRGVTIKAVHRKGKYLWLEFDHRPWLLLHLGMTGDVKIRKKGKDWSGVHLLGIKKNTESKLPRFLRLYFKTNDGTEMAYTDPRRFGRIRLLNDPENEKPISELGIDPLALSADSDRYPKSWLFNHRWGKGKNAMTVGGHKFSLILLVVERPRGFRKFKYKRT